MRNMLAKCGKLAKKLYLCFAKQYLYAMKRLTFLLMTMCVALGMNAQSYSKLWKQYEAAVSDDLPKTALQHVRKIVDKARHDRNMPWLLRGEFAEYALMNDVSSDSSAVVLKQIEADMDAETRPVEKALWQSAVGQLLLGRYMRYYYRPAPADSASVAHACALLRASVQPIEALGAVKAKKYDMLFTKGSESRYYGDDLLSVLSSTAIEKDVFTSSEVADLRSRILAYYQREGNKSAALLTELDIINDIQVMYKPLTSQERFNRLLDVAKRYEPMPLNVETYISLIRMSGFSGADNNDSILVGLAHKGLSMYGKEERANILRQYIESKEHEELNFYIKDKYIYPNAPYELHLRGRHVNSATVRIYRTSFTAEQVTRTKDEKWMDDVVSSGVPYRKIFREFEPHEPYVWFSDTIQFAIDSVGIYVIEVESDKGKATKNLLCVTRLRPMLLTLRGGDGRVVAVDAKSGHPIMASSAKVVKYNYDEKKYEDVGSASSDAEGNIYLRDFHSYNYKCFLSVPGDSYLPAFDYSYSSGGDNNQQRRINSYVYTDRSIYRPGQEVHYGIVAYQQLKDETEVDKGATYTLTLLDSNRDVVEKATLTTDEMGVAGGTFQLPEICLPGKFALRLERKGQGNGGSAWGTFSVEEYKRPTFEVEVLEPTVAYKLGDSLRIEGVARTYTGLPVKSAKVRYEVESRGLYDPASKVFSDNGEATTDDEGHFAFSILLQDDSSSSEYSYWWSWRSGVRRISIKADVTAQNGETQRASRSLIATRRADWLEVEWPNFICKEDDPTIIIKHVGVGGRLLPGGGRYELYRNREVVHTDTFVSGQRLQLPYEKLGSGRYDVRLYCGDIEDRTNSFTYISLADKRPFGSESLCHYELFNANRDSVQVLVGTPHQDVVLFCDIVSQGKILESRRYVVSDTLMLLPFAYEERYGDGAVVLFAFMRDGTMRKFEFTIKKPLPDKRLNMTWSTFRSQLRPGQAEEWKLRITRPDGTPASASLLATLYDASLDQLVRHSLPFGLDFSRYVYPSSWQYHSTPSLSLSSSAESRSFPADDFKFTTWQTWMFGLPYQTRDFMMRNRAMGAAVGSAVMYVEDAEMPMMEAKMVKKSVAVNEMQDSADDAAADSGDEQVQVRSNFAETAFFQPALRTDSKGEVSLVFTLPESLTSWQFRALAHDADVNYGQLDAIVVARKEFMAEMNLPRFIREGDDVVVPATLHNLSEKAESGTVRLRLLDAATERVVGDWKQPFNLAKDGEQTICFPFSAKNLPQAVIVRLTAQGKNFSDGEERLLPVLSDRERVLRSVPFSLNTEGVQELRIDTIMTSSPNASDRRLVVETSSNPAWYAVAELPIIANYECYSATSWATRYYALSLARYIGRENPEIRGLSTSVEKQHAWADMLKRNPDLKQTLLQETPWVAEAKDEAARLDALVELFDEDKQASRMAQTLQSLDDLQNPDGSWSWFKGMGGSPWITTEVCILLARQQTMTGNNQASSRLQRAMAWLEKSVAEDVKAMKKAERRNKEKFSLSEQKLKYLYLRALLGKGADKDTRYLLKHFAEPAEYTMFEKAMIVVIQSHFDMQKEAAIGAQSLLEHTVMSSTMGRSFDTDRALWCWRSYKMPTQTAAIEALHALRAAGVQVKDVGGKADADLSRIIDEMKLWVIQSKRTQDWDMLRATTDAIYCLLQTSARPGQATPLEASSQKTLTYELMHNKKVVARSNASNVKSPTSIGYSRTDYNDAATLRADHIRLNRKGEGPAWGAVFAQYMLPSSEVVATGNGLTVSRRLEVKEGTQWMPLREGHKLHKGDRLRQVFTLTADRDYDFVSLKASRAACMEPTEPLSGYTWRDGIGFYRVVRDASNEYFFETFRKGTHTFTEECFVDRAGSYTLGTAKLQSQYAPEFCGTTGGQVIVVE